MSKQAIFKRTLPRVAICGAILWISSSSALATGNYGTIAFSPSSGGNGYAFGLSARDAAEQVAISECEKYSHSGDCMPVVTTEGGCAALAVGIDSYGSAQGADQYDAQNSALRNCQSAGSGGNCRVLRWLCH